MIEHGWQHAYEPPISFIAGAQLAPQPRQRWRQLPVLEWCAVTQRAGFGHEHRQVVPRIVDGPIAPKAAGMIGHDFTVAAHDDAVGIGTDLHRAADRLGHDGIAVAIEAEDRKSTRLNSSP